MNCTDRQRKRNLHWFFCQLHPDYTTKVKAKLKHLVFINTFMPLFLHNNQPLLTTKLKWLVLLTFPSREDWRRDGSVKNQGRRTYPSSS